MPDNLLVGSDEQIVRHAASRFDIALANEGSSIRAMKNADIKTFLSRHFSSYVSLVHIPQRWIEKVRLFQALPNYYF